MKKTIFLIIGLVGLMFFQASGQGCMDASSDEGVNVVGYVQPQFEHNFLGDDLFGKSLDESSFYFNRARIGVVGNIPYDFSYYVMAELSPTIDGPKLLDAFIAYNRFAPYVKFSIGQFKSPFGLELTTPCQKLHTINRSHVVGQLAGPWRDLGFMISGGTGELSVLGSKTENFFGYSLAMMNGTGINTFDNNPKKSWIGRFTIHPLEFVTLGASYRFGKHPSETAEEDDERSRFGFDLELKYKEFMVQGEYIDGSDKGSYTVGGGCGDPLQVLQGSVDRNGFFAQAMYKSKWNLQPVVKIERYDPDISDDGMDDQINTITYGLNYFFNEWTRFQINYLYRAEENARVEIPNDAILFQFQVIF